MKLFLILDEDNCVYIYSSAESAAAAIEALDVEVIKAAFDEDAYPYHVEWIKPNEFRKVLGIIPLVINGEYRFVVAGESNFPAFLKMIREAQAIMSGENKPNQSIDEYVNKLTNLYKE